MSQNKNQSFGDSKTLMAILLSTVVFLLWNQWMKDRYPQLDNKKNPTEVTQANEGAEKTIIETNDVKIKPTMTPTSEESTPNEKIIVAEKEETLTTYKDETFSFDISSKGMGIKNIQLNKYTDRKGVPIKMGSNEGFLPFETNLIGRRKAMDFDIKKINSNTYVGISKQSNVVVEKKIVINSEEYLLETEVSVKGGENFQGIVTYLTDTISENEAGGMLSANRFELQEFFVNHGTQEDREVISLEEEINLPFNKVNAASIGSQYFALGFVNESDIFPNIDVISDLKSKTAITKFFHKVINRNDNFKINYKAYVGPKSLVVLEKVSDNITGMIDFGFFSSISLLMQKVLTFFHNYTGNWGVAIILLTLLVRLLVLPTALSSYKSMRNMSKLAPLMKEIKEKYKDDPNQRNAATMQLYKEHKVNPIGGCLPMLLQLPVFFALYQVLGVSIDLYQMPFIFWIDDLSIKDPYYVLPVLMGVTMFLQQKLTPTTMDPAQAKVMMFMPLFFSFLMASLPSGLTLYIFVSGLFGIFQQLYFMKEKKQEQAKTSV